MPLILTLSHLRGSQPRETRILTEGNLTIGRAQGNNWVLPDPDRHLSKFHCMISAEGGRYILNDLSTNGVFINGAQNRTQPNSRTPLAHGDEIRLGDYVLSVAESGPTATTSPAIGDDLFAAPAPQTGPQLEPFAPIDPLATASGPAGSSGFSHPVSRPAPALRADDPFDLADEKQAYQPSADEDLFRGQQPAENWDGPSQRDDLDAQLQAFSAPKPLPTVDPNEIDFDALLGNSLTDLPEPLAPRPAAPSAPATPTAWSSPAAAPPPPRVPAPAAAPVAVAPVMPTPQPAVAEPAADGSRLLAAFLQAAGVPDLQVADPERTLRAAGEVFRAMVEGLLQVLMSRAEIKNALRVERTILRAGDNNPLKFAAGSEDAIAALLLPKKPGYKARLESTREAFDDIKAHEMAVMAGVQTALLGLLKRFEPAALESRLQPGMIDSVLPVARKARFWEMFCATYRDIAREAQDDFNAVFGREFARAYDAQSQKL
jgi:type VI secretion system protein